MPRIRGVPAEIYLQLESALRTEDEERCDGKKLLYDGVDMAGTRYIKCPGCPACAPVIREEQG